LIEDGDRVGFKEDAASVVAEWADPKEGVFERGHDFAAASREGWEEVVSLGRGVVAGSCCISYSGGGSRGIDVGDWGIWGEVDIAGAGVKDGGV